MRPACPGDAIPLQINTIVRGPIADYGMALSTSDADPVQPIVLNNIVADHARRIHGMVSSHQQAVFTIGPKEIIFNGPAASSLRRFRFNAVRLISEDHISTNSIETRASEMDSYMIFSDDVL